MSQFYERQRFYRLGETAMVSAFRVAPFMLPRLTDESFYFFLGGLAQEIRQEYGASLKPPTDIPATNEPRLELVNLLTSCVHLRFRQTGIAACIDPCD